MKILLTGANGQLGSELARQLSHFDLVACTRVELDLAQAPSDIQAYVEDIRPDLIVNAAAYTAVDKAESERDLAFAINSGAVAALASAAAKINAPLIHYSTDYVFAGDKQGAYLESDGTSPINVYGESKRAGELAIAETGCRHLIFRTSWVVGLDGANFIKTILRLAGTKEALNVVADQIGVPTSARVIAQVTVDAIKAESNGASWASGIYHLATRGEANWHKVACRVVDAANRCGVPLTLAAASIKAIATEDYPTDAQRPLNSRLNTDKLRQCLSFDLPEWEGEVDDIVTALTQKEIS